MDVEEEKEFYRSAVENIRIELSNDLEVLQQADLYNKEVVRSVITSMSEVEYVVFKDGDWKGSY
jgi:hypothetical protein